MARHGGMAGLFGRVYAPSTLSGFLRAFTYGYIRHLQGVSLEVMIRLARRTRLLPGVGTAEFIDVGLLLRRVYGRHKQGAGFGHAKVGGYQVLFCGLNPLMATISTPDAAQVVAATQLVGRCCRLGAGVPPWLVAEAIATTKAVTPGLGPTSRLRHRANSWCGQTRGSTPRGDRRVPPPRPVAVLGNRAHRRQVRRAIATNAGGAWTEIRYPQQVFDDEQQRLISCAQIAEAIYTPRSKPSATR